MAGKRGVLGLRQFKPPLQLRQRGGERGRAQSVECQCGASPFHRIAVYEQGVYGPMTVEPQILRVLEQEDINFLLTNRIPRRLATQFIGWFSRIEQPLVRDLSIAVWRFFSDLDLQRGARSRSSAACTIASSAELKDGARPIDPDPNILVSPCDAIVGACGAIRRHHALSDQGLSLCTCRICCATTRWSRPIATAATSRCGSHRACITASTRRMIAASSR